MVRMLERLQARQPFVHNDINMQKQGGSIVFDHQIPGYSDHCPMLYYYFTCHGAGRYNTVVSTFDGGV